MATRDTSNDHEVGRYLVHPHSDLLDDRTRVLKYGDTFAVFDRRGDAMPFRTSSHGIYHRGTRFLSGLALRVCGERPLLLGSSARQDNALLAIDLANPELCRNGETIAADTIHVFRSRFIDDGTCYERLRVTNHGMTSLDISLSLDFEADFVDLFEVRGAKRPRRGTRFPPEVASSRLVLRYEGLDRIVRQTCIVFDPAPTKLSETNASYRLQLDPKGEAELSVIVDCILQTSPRRSTPPDHDRAFESVCHRLRAARDMCCEIRTSNELFNDWLERSLADLHMMITETEHGPYPYAGVPWFNAVFGRDGLITAREMLWLDPTITKGVLRCLAESQATERSDSEDAEPGKIIHEAREGEMVALGELPFGRYYGSIDATPLFVMLAQDYFVRTGDVATVESLWPALRRALAWIDDHGDQDGDGFVEYARHNPQGLIQQGWKDSNDSVFYEDGRIIEGPVALCEVQGYAYAAREAGAKLALMFGDTPLGIRLEDQAQKLKARFAEKYWCQELGTYALALDGSKRQCRVVSSNAGHCLFAGIADARHAEQVMSLLMGETMFSGWGIRTLASTEVRYNPMSYHNGSIWPHDNALLALGMARYGRRDYALRILEGLFHASLFMEMQRMPELFCGFRRRTGQGPTLYPVACSPQAWAAGSVFLTLEACLGLSIEGGKGQVRFHQPSMPSSLDWIELRNLSVGSASVDLLLRRARSDVAIEVLAKRGDAAVLVTKSV